MICDSKVYLDYASRTPLRREVLDRMLPYLTCPFGVPGQVHSVSRKADGVLADATASIARCLNAAKSEIQIASGVSEANTLAILGLARCYGSANGHILTTKFEHQSVLEACRILEGQGFTVTYLEPDECGVVSVQSVKAAIQDETFLAAISLVNSESGAIQPIQEISRILQKAGVLIHCDAGAGALLGINPRELGVHSLTLASEQIYGPQGAAVLWLRHDIECDSRPVVENLSAVVGLAQALVFLDYEGEDLVRRLAGLKVDLIENLRAQIPSAELRTSVQDHPGILALSVEDVLGCELAEEIDRWGVCVAATEDGIRISWGRHSNTEDLKKAVSAIVSALHELRVRHRLVA